MYHINIAGIHAILDTPYPINLRKTSDFLQKEAHHVDVHITAKPMEHLEKPAGISLISEEVGWIQVDDPDYPLCCYFYDEILDKLMAMMYINNSWDKAKIEYLELEDYSRGAIVNIVFEVLFRMVSLRHDSFVLHASAIRHDGKGIVFTAPSGTGKSTHASLWDKHLGAEILNDDRPCIRLEQDAARIYGTPWTGSWLPVKNLSADLSAIVVLLQSKENSIHRLTHQEAVQMLLPRMFLPYFNKELMDQAIGILEKLLFRIPVYLLHCRPDKEAAELVHEYLWQN